MIVVLTTDEGQIGVSEVPGGQKITDTLEKAKDMLVSSKTINYASLPSFSSSCDEVASSSLLGGDHGDFYVSFDDHQFDHKSNGHDFFARSMS